MAEKDSQPKTMEDLNAYQKRKAEEIYEEWKHRDGFTESYSDEELIKEILRREEESDKELERYHS